jgi:hypothetical protein
VIAVYVERGAKRSFACSLEWPGWCRSGRDEEQALEALAAYAPRYAVVAGEAGLRFPSRLSFEVTERLAGSASTDFGAPGAVPVADGAALTPAGARRLAGLVEASWRVLDRVAAGAPAELRKGPRGGGRDRDAIVAHVADAEVAYARKVGLPRTQAGPGLRQLLADTIRARRDAAGTGWPVRYAARRIAWHALDHAWEIEDRSSPT